MSLDDLLNKIHHSDALELLARLPDASVDMVLADMPYGVTDCKWDTPLPLEPLWKELKRIAKPRSVFAFTATEPFATTLRMSAIDLYKYDWFWANKECPTLFIHAKNRPMRIIENVCIFSKGAINHKSVSKRRMPYNPQMREGKAYNRFRLNNESQFGSITGHRPSHKLTYGINEGRYPIDLLEFGNSNHNNLHPTQKPVALFEYLIKTYTQEGEIVLDMTCGSGTTAIAARKCNRQFICGDLELEYVEIARKRLQDTDPFQDTVLSNGQKQMSLFRGME